MGVKSEENLSEYAAKYRELRPRYEKLANEIHFAINEKLESERIPIAPVTYRAKDVEKFLEKSVRKSYKDPLKETEDLAGVRVVCLYESDLQKVGEIIRSEFTVIKEEDKRDGLGTDKMGYQDKQFIVELGNGYSGPHYDGLHGLKCEIQVRTVLQDAWAIISHHLEYKKDEDSIPEKLRRDFNSVASLLEIAQDVVENFREKRGGYVGELLQIGDSDMSSFLRLPVNYDTLEAYTRWKFPDFKFNMSLHADLASTLERSKYKSLQDIDDIVMAAEKAVWELCLEKPKDFKSGTNFLGASLFFVDKKFRGWFSRAYPDVDYFEKYKHLVKTKPAKK
ncbi:MAG TPA: GTP pyrophosphokinase [Candidatus Brocadiia bacterium]|nr:hypothetical protein [Candidatus Brocadiales bacterium]